MASPVVVFLGLFSVFSVVLAATTGPQEKVSVTVYFESYCPDSVKFLTKQLYPLYVSPLEPYMNITLVPFGKATFTKSEAGDYTFDCHHGEKECRGNKAIACVLKEKDSTFADQFKFINCTSSMIAANTKMETYPIKECAMMANMKEEMIRSCAEGMSGSEFLAEYGNKTHDLNPPLTSVPTVVFNDKFMKSDSDMAVSDFRKALCSRISGTKPAECAKSGAPVLQTAILPVIAAFLAVSRV